HSDGERYVAINADLSRSKSACIDTYINATDRNLYVEMCFSAYVKNILTQLDHSATDCYVVFITSVVLDNLASIHTDINDMLNNLELDRGYTASLVGDFEEQQQAATDLVVIFLISLFLVFVVMAIQFNSLKHPIIILFIIPVTLTGVLIGL